MPFVYYGGKKGLARYYPPPKYPVIIEPFAGSAGYALHWAKPGQKVILIERDPVIAGLWRQIRDDPQAVASIACPPVGSPCFEPLIALAAGGEGGVQAATSTAFSPGGFSITARIARDWEAMRYRLLVASPRIQHWTIHEGDYTDAPDKRATWFIDPPYWVPEGAKGSRGDGYRFGASQIDFAALGEWCQARRGQVIVCEQEGATWLPFRPFRAMTTAAGDGGRRVEVIWTRGEEAPMPRTRQQRDEAAKRRSARMNRRV